MGVPTLNVIASEHNWISFEVAERPDVAVLKPRGRLLYEQTGIKDVIIGLLNASKDKYQTVLVDMADVKTMDSAGFGNLVSSYRSLQNAGKNFGVYDAHGQPMEHLKIMKLIPVLYRGDTLEHALTQIPLPASQAAAVSPP